MVGCDRQYKIGGVYHANVYGGHFIIVAEVKDEGVMAHVCTSQSSSVARGAIPIGPQYIGDKDTYVLPGRVLIRHELVKNPVGITIDKQLASDLGIKL